MKKIFKTIYYIGGTVYRGLIGIFDNLFDKEEKISNEVGREVIGKSVKGREILAYKIGNGENKLLITGGIHGNEVGTVKLAKKIINYFANKNFPPKTDQPIDENIQLFIIPVLNIDGYLQAKKNPDYMHRGKIGRFNACQVDLNRNFSTQNFKQYSEWGVGKNYSDEKIKIFCGGYGASEPETKALINFIKNNNIKNLIMLHNVGKDVIIAEDDEVAVKWAEIYEKYAKFKIRYDLGYSGGAMDWAKENNINYMAIEGTSRWGSDWKKQQKAIIKILKN
ncbi:MAG: M14 family metallopeptidase [Patescibacteria group bacterium]